MRLTRAARRPLDFPNIAQAFNGTAQDKRELLRKFLSAGENLQDLEAHFTAERSVEDQTEEVTEAMTVRQMREAGFSEAKIAAVTAKGGLPDADAPNDYESMRFWCTKKLVKTARDTSTVKASVTARVQGQAALSALCSSVSRSTVAVPDAQALLAQVGHSRGSANDPAPAPKPKAKAGARKNGSAPSSAKGLSLKLANGKTLEDKTLALRVALSCTLQFFLQSPVRVGAEIKKEVNSLNGLVMQVLDTRVKKAQVAAMLRELRKSGPQFFCASARGSVSFALASCVALQGVWRQLIAAEPRGPLRLHGMIPRGT
ncbi:unnamed protein product [Effrenium voratum]|nr:unnamed protein product [Effrenium voratum]